MAKKNIQVFYPKYAGFIVLYAMIFVQVGVIFAKLLDKLFPTFEETNPKHSVYIYIEVLIQIGAVGVITYIFREYTSYFIESSSLFKKHMYGSPDKFAALIIAPTMFSVQPNLIRKIRYLVDY